MGINSVPIFLLLFTERARVEKHVIKKMKTYTFMLGMLNILLEDTVHYEPRKLDH